MTNEHNEQAILLLHTLRTGYICDPNECKFTKGDENCILCECDNYHDALALAIDCIEKQSEIVHCKDCENWKAVTIKTIDGRGAEFGQCELTKWLCGKQGYCMYGKEVE